LQHTPSVPVRAGSSSAHRIPASNFDAGCTQVFAFTNQWLSILSKMAYRELASEITTPQEVRTPASKKNNLTGQYQFPVR